jgi:hypothetical protein
MQSLPEKVQNFVDKVAGEKQGSNDDLSIQVTAQSASQAEFDRKLLEMRSQQELRKEWLLFLLKAGKDAVIAFLSLVRYNRDPPKSPLKRGTFNGSHLSKGGEGGS